MRDLAARLGLNIDRDQWASTPVLKAYEAAGFAWVQVHTPPPAMLADRERCLRHARALRAGLARTRLRLLVHGPDDLSVGGLEADRCFDGLLEYAAEAGAELVVYHGLNIAQPAGEAVELDPQLLHRVAAEERSLQRFAARAEALGLTIAIENLAPVYPSPPWPSRLCHDPIAVRDLVRRLGSPAVGLLLDVGHAHITAALSGRSTADVVEELLDEVVLFHVHDNLGARRHDLDAPGVDPLKLDLHLPPGGGSLPWDRVGPLMVDHDAPLMLEVERSHVTAPASLATITLGLLQRGTHRLAA